MNRGLVQCGAGSGNVKACCVSSIVVIEYTPPLKIIPILTIHRNAATEVGF